MKTYFNRRRNRMKQKLYTLLSLLVLASMVLAACGAPVATEAPATDEAPATEPAATDAAACEPAGTEPITFADGGKSVTGAWDQEPDSIVPYFSQMSFAIWVTQLTLVGLGEWDDQNNFVPELAAEVPTSENGGVS